MQRTTPAPHNVMPLAIGFTRSGAGVFLFGYDVVVLGKVASVMPLRRLALPLISGVRLHKIIQA
jgi:hypothetical protein